MEISGGTWLILVGVAMLSLALGFAARALLSRRKIAEAAEKSRQIIAEAEREAERKRKEAELECKDMLFRAKTDLEKEARQRRDELQGLERRLLQREESLDRKGELLERRDREMREKEAECARRERTLRESEARYQALLAEVRQQ